MVSDLIIDAQILNLALHIDRWSRWFRWSLYPDLRVWSSLDGHNGKWHSRHQMLDM